MEILDRVTTYLEWRLYKYTHIHIHTLCTTSLFVLLLLSLNLSLAPQMRKTVSFPDSQALLHVRTHAVLKVDQIGERGSMPQMGRVEVVAAAALFYKGVGQGKTRPDSSHHPTGRSLILEKNVVEER